MCQSIRGRLRSCAPLRIRNHVALADAGWGSHCRPLAHPDFLRGPHFVIQQATDVRDPRHRHTPSSGLGRLDHRDIALCVCDFKTAISLPLPSWRYVHDRLEVTDGLKNVVFVWTPNIPDGSVFGSYADYYPGDACVDWVGASGFNWGSQSIGGSTGCLAFDDLFSGILSDLTSRYPTKPQMVAEFASACANGCDKTLWIPSSSATSRSSRG